MKHKFDRAAWEARKREARMVGWAAGAALAKIGKKVECPYKEGTSLYCIFYSGVVTGAQQEHADPAILFPSPPRLPGKSEYGVIHSLLLLAAFAPMLTE